MTPSTLLASTAIMLAALLVPSAAGAQQQAEAGPIIQSAGAVFAVDPDVPTPADRDYKLAFDVSAPAPAPDRLNSSFNSVARFLNMHGQAGVPGHRLKGAIVAHGAASFELLDDEAYRTRFGVANPNGALLRELIRKGHPVILCGQSAASRNVPTDELIPGVEVALSAMTAFMLLQSDGYRVNPW